MDELGAALDAAGGLAAGPESAARLRTLLADELRRGAAELALKRSGYDAPVTVAVAPAGAGLRAAAPVAAALRADPDAVVERAWLLVAALTGALVEVGGRGVVLAGALGGEHLVLEVPGDPADAELVPLAFEGQVAGIDRLRARAVAVPAFVLEDADDVRAPIGMAHPLVVAAAVAALGGRPADAASLAEHEDAVLALLDPTAAAAGVARPHEDPDPARRVARRILQRLNGMGKWGGYHTDFKHLARGFAGNDRKLAEAVGEALLEAGLLAEKPSVGQRHVFLNPRRAGDIHAFIEAGEAPAGLDLP
jgi:hypothetical protein